MDCKTAAAHFGEFVITKWAAGLLSKLHCQGWHLVRRNGIRGQENYFALCG